MLRLRASARRELNLSVGELVVAGSDMKNNRLILGLVVLLGVVTATLQLLPSSQQTTPVETLPPTTTITTVSTTTTTTSIVAPKTTTTNKPPATTIAKKKTTATTQVPQMQLTGSPQEQENQVVAALAKVAAVDEYGIWVVKLHNLRQSVASYGITIAADPGTDVYKISRSGQTACFKRTPKGGVELDWDMRAISCS